jgi:DNA-binding transcriptional ArsR family regulator
MSQSHDERSPEDAPPPRFENPRSIRALAHPARMAIIDALAAGDELTATQCAELTGLSPSATAYHLKLLERYGLAETASPRSDRRERPWRAARRHIQADLDTSTPATASAAAAVAAASAAPRCGSGRTARRPAGDEEVTFLAAAPVRLSGIIQSRHRAPSAATYVFQDRPGRRRLG